MKPEFKRDAYPQELVRTLYEAREKAERDRISRMVQARSEGREEGLAEGQRLTAREMLGLGLDPAVIERVTGLSLTEISKLGG